MKKLYIGIIITLVNLVLSFVIIYFVRQETNQFKKERTEIARLLNFNDRMLDVKESIPLFGAWVWEKKKKRFEHEVYLANKAYETAKKYVWWLLIVNLVFGIIVFVLYYKNHKWFAWTLVLISFAAVGLTGGVFTPMLELEAFKEDLSVKIEIDAKEMMGDIQETVEKVPFVGETLEKYIEDLLPQLPNEKYVWQKVFPGKMYFFYENKGIFDVLRTLWKTSNEPIAIIIGVFSFVIPTLKLFFTYIMLFLPTMKAHALKKWVAYLTKFSMVDVVVIALFITYFTFDELSHGIQTSSNALMGVYFFCVYVIFAILSGFTLERWMDQQMKKANAEE